MLFYHSISVYHISVGRLTNTVYHSLPGMANLWALLFKWAVINMINVLDISHSLSKWPNIASNQIIYVEQNRLAPIISISYRQMIKFYLNHLASHKLFGSQDAFYSMNELRPVTLEGYPGRIWFPQNHTQRKAIATWAKFLSSRRK